MKRFLLLILFPAISFSQSPDIQLNLLANGFTNIVDIVSAGDDRLFIVDGKQVKILLNGVKNPTPFIDLYDKAIWIMAVAFHPNYSQNGYFYVKYKAKDTSCVIARFTVSENPDVANVNSETLIFSYPNNNGHEGGDLEFGKDNLLYTTTGDGAGGARNTPGDEFGYAQNMTIVEGKMLRFDVDSPATNYIPAANPYQYPNDGIPDQIIASGLRNPWKFSFDRQTGDVWIGDVGQDSYEEVDFVPFGSFEGRNYGWSCYEGNMPHISQNCPNNLNTLTYPIVTIDGYNFNGNQAASVTGGYVYRGTKYPALTGFYVYSDYNTGRFWVLKKLTNGTIINDLKGILMSNPTTFGEDKNGEMYVATFHSIYQITACGTDQNLTLDGAITNSGYFTALNNIQSTNSINMAIDVIFSAGNKIELNTGFLANAGSVFTAQISGCQ